MIEESSTKAPKNGDNQMDMETLRQRIYIKEQEIKAHQKENDELRQEIEGYKQRLMESAKRLGEDYDSFTV